MTQAIRTDSDASEPLAAVVIPLHRLPLTGDEEISLRTVREILGKYPRFFLLPSDLSLPEGFLCGEEVLRFSEKFFTYPHGYNRLLMSACFYKAFSEYSHSLLYQLDCLVFRDELDAWCSRNYDYIGSPWLDGYGNEPGGDPVWRVGNGGFSLRKVATARAVLETRIPRGQLYPVPPIHLPTPGFWDWLITNLRKRIKQHMNLWTVEDELGNYAENEDRFWALDVLKIRPDYAKPDVEEAFGFGFEIDPRRCLERTKGRLPFGCHAWGKHDREFWLQTMDGKS